MLAMEDGSIDAAAVSVRQSRRRLLFLVALLVVAPMSSALAQGGCGSVCIPLEILDPEQAQLSARQIRIAVTTQSGRFDRFREGADEIPNPGGNNAIIQDTTLFLDYGVTSRFTLSLMAPFIKKIQSTNNFGDRVAEGLGDVAVFGRYEILTPKSAKGPSFSLGLGLKFPTGEIDEPGTAQPTLPPAFQNGSGAYDVLPTFSYYQSFSQYSLFGSSFVRIPMEENEKGYRFGREFELHFGVAYPFPIWKGRLELTATVDYLNAGHDKDSASILPGRLRDGTKVLNSGGEFIDLTPGLRLRVSPSLTLQVRYFIAVQEDWNGFRPLNVGQVAPDVTSQFAFSYVVK